MKRISLLLCLLLVFSAYLTGTLQAQTVPQFNTRKEIYKPLAAPKFNPTRAHSKGAFVEHWYNFSQILGENTANNPTGLNKISGRYLVTLFPDTTVLIKYLGVSQPDTMAAPNTHAVGQIWDFRASYFQLNPYQMDDTYAVTLDSIAIPYLYQRWNPDPSIVDTLLVQFYDNTALRALVINGGVPPYDMAIASIDYNHLTNKGKGAKREMKIPLTATDEFHGTPTGNPGEILLDNFIIIGADTPLYKLPKGSRLGMTVSFIPGYEYSLTAPYDTLQADSSTFKRLNQFRMVQLGLTELFADTKSSDLAKNQIWLNGLSVDSRTRGNTGNWAGRYFPGLYLTNGLLATTLMDIQVKISALSQVGINNINAEGYGMGDAYPNPTGGNDVILNFSIASSQSVTFNLSNVYGQTIISTTENFAAGENSMEIKTSNLQAGIYFYTLTSGTFSQTKKLTVTK